MFTRNFATLFSTLVCTVVFVSAAQAHEFKSGDIRIIHPFARATVAQQTNGSAYLSIENNGKTDDKLMKVESDVATSAEIHSMEMAGDVMKMREVEHIGLAAGSTVSMKPGSQYHIMLIGLKKTLQVGDKFPMTLYFEKAGKVDVVVKVEAQERENPKAHKHPA